ncbi:hypothetical protein M6I34_06135 [Burkholderiaceae bacterium FT117]|uniref:hypothetical protein n=1 Tax=Zeimonas sediminis TaxID=2944268 RepID=UPI002342E7BF|nr:hypothetical protein [Zeimonas sediminis]MCM5570080.1 hypothetical protein [Zeimonas sediminis]
MIKNLLAAVALSCAVAVPAYAQGAASSTDPVVQMRAAEREANKVYALRLMEAWSNRSKKVNAAAEAATRRAAEDGKDPLVAKRDAIAQAEKSTQGEYDAALKAALDERDAAIAAAKKKGSGSKG